MTENETPSLEDIVTHTDLAAFLGVSTRSLSYYRIPHIDVGRQRLYFKQTVALWLSRREGKGRVSPDRG